MDVQTTNDRLSAAGMVKLLVTVNEAMAMTGLGRTTAYQLVATGEWPSVRVGRAVRIPVTALKDWVGQHTQLGQVA